MVQWPELCGRGASSLTSSCRRASANNSTQSTPTTSERLQRCRARSRPPRASTAGGDAARRDGDVEDVPSRARSRPRRRCAIGAVERRGPRPPRARASKSTNAFEDAGGRRARPRRRRPSSGVGIAPGPCRRSRSSAVLRIAGVAERVAAPRADRRRDRTGAKRRHREAVLVRGSPSRAARCWVVCRTAPRGPHRRVLGDGLERRRPGCSRTRR